LLLLVPFLDNVKRIGPWKSQNTVSITFQADGCVWISFMLLLHTLVSAFRFIMVDQVR
jgi:hypothetical protein